LASCPYDLPPNYYQSRPHPKASALPSSNFAENAKRHQSATSSTNAPNGNKNYHRKEKRFPCARILLKSETIIYRLCLLLSAVCPFVAVQNQCKFHSWQRKKVNLLYLHLFGLSFALLLPKPIQWLAE
jgi:hypothetical protein